MFLSSLGLKEETGVEKRQLIGTSKVEFLLVM